MSMNKDNMASINGVVKINVGGKEFLTLLATLNKADTLSRFIGGQQIRNMVNLQDGSIFVDRDPKHFPLIINFLRDFEYFQRQRMVSIPTKEEERDELELEATFYGIEQLVAYCKNLGLNRKPCNRR